MRVVAEIIKHGFIEEKTVFIDGTHIKANANNHKYKKEVVAKSAKYYEEELQKEIAKDREKHGKKPLKPIEQKDETKQIQACFPRSFIDSVYNWQPNWIFMVNQKDL